MRLFRDFLCEYCGEEIERYVDADTRTTPCQCGNDAVRLIGMPRVALEGCSGHFPGAHSHWADIREANARQKVAKRARHGE